MDFLNVFESMEKYEDADGEYQYQAPTPPRYTDHPINNVVDDFERFNHSTMYYNLDGYISPYSYMNWGANTEIVSSVIEEGKIPAFLDRIDPNQIFTSDMSELRKLASDQNKIVKMFERRLMESLTAQGKMGLDENDIEAMQALTSARSAITSIAKEKTNIKTKIAELKIKQQTAANASNVGNPQNGNGLSPQNPYAARSIMDNIFELGLKEGIPVNPNVPVPTVDPSTIPIDELGEKSDTTTTAFENLDPKIMVLADPTGNVETAEYFVIDKDGNELTEFPKPKSPITSIDLTTNPEKPRATNQIGCGYDVRIRKPITDENV